MSGFTHFDEQGNAIMVDVSEKEAKKYIKKIVKYYESYEDVKITAAYKVKGKVSIKADKETRMGIITDIKQALRRAQALKINYAATQRMSY